MDNLFEETVQLNIITTKSCGTCANKRCYANDRIRDTFPQFSFLTSDRQNTADSHVSFCLFEFCVIILERGLYDRLGF
jgi:hypothetical protein